MRVALIAVLGVVAACGDDGVNVSTSESNFCDQIADVVCHNLYQCCTESEIEGYLDVSEPRTELQCREDVKRRCDRQAPDIRDSLEAGRIEFDSVRLNDCLNAVLAPDDVCSEVVTELPWKEACEEAPWVGMVQTGGSCFFNHDCAGYPDSFCGPDQKCKAKPTAGFPCGTGCASDFYCNTTNQTCAAKGTLGAPCIGNVECQKDLYCDVPSGTTMGMCAMKQGGGSACRSDAACLSSDCVPGMCMGTTQSCYESDDCQSRCANTGFSCDAASDCGNGNCSISGTTCSEFSPCGGGTGDNCVYPVQCVPGSCVGDPVCTSQTVVADYCSGIGVIPDP